MSKETYAFQAEINQLLSLIINTFYSNKDVFLRELISNASDAIDKAKYNSLSSGGADLREYTIEIKADSNKNTLTIKDNGIGLSKDDMINCLGTIANSGTKHFMELLKSGSDISMIGQFGVGFYSAYLVADTVQVFSKKNDEELVHCWESKAGGSFTITEMLDYNIQVGTEIVLHMKDDCSCYLNQDKIKEIVKIHSEFITYPIKLWTKTSLSREVPDCDEEKGECEEEEGECEEEKGECEEGSVEDVIETKPPKTKTITDDIEEWKQLNTQKPIWQQKPDDVSNEEYVTFYKSLTNDWDSHMAMKHFVAEGQIEYKSLLYIPKRAPFDMFKTSEKKNNIKLYVKRVFIMDKFEELLPDWLGFVSGVVDSDDLPLNVSREMLQQNNVLKVIQKNLVKKCVEMITDLAEDEDTSKYVQFYEQFQQSIKLGIHEDTKHKDKLIKLLRFKTAKNKEFVSLDEYVKNMKDDQKDIYFITGESCSSVEKSPFVNGVTSKGFDVIFMVDAIDEYMMQKMKSYDNKKLVDITKNNTNFTEKNEEYDNHICKRMKQVLDVENVVVSSRLGEDPCCLVSSEYGYSANMERIMKAQTLSANKSFGLGTKKTLEINPSHEMIKKLQDGVQNSSMTGVVIDDVIRLMYDTAIISCGYSHEDPSDFSNRIYKMIALGIGIDNLCVGEVVPTPENTMESVDIENTMESVDIENTMESVD
jgi:molecular chaperone HtpG